MDERCERCGMALSDREGYTIQHTGAYERVCHPTCGGGGPKVPTAAVDVARKGLEKEIARRMPRGGGPLRESIDGADDPLGPPEILSEQDQLEWLRRRSAERGSDG